MHAAKSVGTESLALSRGSVFASVDPGQPVRMCRLKFDPQAGPQYLQAWHIPHDNFAYCDANHKHRLSCDHTRHSLKYQPEAIFLLLGWVVFFAIYAGKGNMNWLKNMVKKVLAPVAMVAAVAMAPIANAQAFVVATLPAEITTLVTDAEGLRDDVISFKVVVVGAVIGFAFIGWLISRRK